MFWLIVLIILILIIHSMMKATTGVAKAVGKGVAHDMSQINAELTNKTTITNYLDYLVNCKGWKKSGTLLVIYEAPNGKTGSYIQWEQRIMANHKATDVLSNAEVAAFFQMYDAPIKKVGTSKTINTKIIPKTENDYGSPAIRARFTPDNVMYLFLKSGYSASVMVKPPSFLL